MWEVFLASVRTKTPVEVLSPKSVLCNLKNYFPRKIGKHYKYITLMDKKRQQPSAPLFFIVKKILRSV